MSRCYRINEPAVAVEMHDGDAILINFENGRYYDTAGAGGEIVRLLLQGHDLGEIARALATAAGEDAAGVDRAVGAFVDALTGEGLLIATDAPGEREVPLAPALPAGFVAPALNRHVELEDLLRLDPIHDADDAGWPVPKAGGAKPGGGR
ncbi:MAG TPA: PqqD family protein [Polyangia bacterium]|nr:PqqD family protein [Polyangia bacterium]